MIRFDKLIESSLKDEAEFKARRRGKLATEDEICAQAERMIKAGYQPYDRKAFEELAKYMVYHARGVASRGLMLMGTPGNGKTMWLNSFAGCKVYTAQGMFDLFLKDKASRIAARERVYLPAYGNEPTNYRSVAIDDIGAEPVAANNYGTVENPIQVLLEHRYVEFQRYNSKLYLSTNLDKKQIAERYGERVWSRIRAMCTIIEFTAEDYRQR